MAKAHAVTREVFESLPRVPDMFQNKEDGVVKVLLKPYSASPYRTHLAVEHATVRV